MNKGNFTAKSTFPVSNQTYDFIQQMAILASKAFSLGGSNYILSGCTIAGTQVSEGLIVINGEILPFEAGVLSEKITIQEIRESDNAFGVDYPEAYIHRTAKFSVDGEYLWDDFVRVLTNLELQKKINDITGDIPGIVKMWSGLISRVPADYMLCDGASLLRADYPKLYDNIELTFGGDATSFNLPNLKNKFIAGFDVDKSDYNKIGKTGGEEFHALTADENGEHQHIVPWGENLNTAWKPDWSWPDDRYNNSRGATQNSIDDDNTWPYTSPSGKGKPHENRPQFFVLAYIIKVK